MCGRYTLSKTEELRQRFGIEANGFDVQPRYNVCHEQAMPVIVSEGRPRLELMQWGLVLCWSNEPKSIAINARIEGILSKPSFRRPILYQRCLIPACGFYEWKKEPGGKVPHHIHRKDGGLFAFAGIYDNWRDPQGSQRRTFAILTTAASEFVSRIHNRMPLILPPEQEEMWLATDPAKIESLLASLRAVPDQHLEMYPVSKMVNYGKNDGPELLQRADERQIQFPMEC